MPKTVQQWVKEHPLFVALASECDQALAELETLRCTLRAADFVHRASSAIIEADLAALRAENQKLRKTIARLEFERLKVRAEVG